MHRTCVKLPLIALASMGVTTGCDRDTPPASRPAATPHVETATEPLRVRVTGHDFTWRVRYPGPDHRLDTADDILARRHLHLPAETRVQIELRSDDFVYSVYLPDYEMVEMAFPGRPYVVELATNVAGTSGFLGSQMCGFAHEQLLGDLVVQSPDDFRQWMRQGR